MVSDRLPQCSAAHAIHAFERLGFVHRRTTGSHVILRHPISKRTISIPLHSGDLKRGLLFGLIKQAGIDQKIFLENL